MFGSDPTLEVDVKRFGGIWQQQQQRHQIDFLTSYTRAIMARQVPLNINDNIKLNKFMTYLQ